VKKLEKTIEYLFYLFIFLLPWQTCYIWRDTILNGYTWEYGRLCLYGTEILLWLIIILFGTWLLFLKPRRFFNFFIFFNKLKEPRIFIYWLIILFAIWAGLSSFWALDFQLAYIRWVQLVEAICLVAIILHLNFRLEKIAVVWAASAGVQSLLAIWQFFTQYAFANKWLGLAEHLSLGGGSIILQTDSGRWLRAYGSLPHPNVLGGFLVLALIFLIYLSLRAVKRGQRIFILTNLIVIVPALFFTFSRSAWVALFGFFAIFTFWLWRQKNMAWFKVYGKVVFIFTLITLILAGLFSSLLLSRVVAQTDLEAQSISLRVAFSKQALSLLKNNWLLGEGLGNYTLAIHDKFNSSWPGYYYQPVHNIYLLVPAELGIFGFALFGLILLLIFWYLFKNQDLEKVIIFLSLLMILIISLFDHYFWTLFFGSAVFWLVLGLGLRRLVKD